MVDYASSNTYICMIETSYWLRECRILGVNDDEFCWRQDHPFIIKNGISSLVLGDKSILEYLNSDEQFPNEVLAGLATVCYHVLLCCLSDEYNKDVKYNLYSETYYNLRNILSK